MANYENKINMMQAENDRINGILKSRLSDIEEWKGKYMRIEATMGNYTDMEREKKKV